MISGRQFDAKGNIRNWWTKYSSMNFNERAKCMMDQYSNYKIEEVNKKVSL